MRAKIKRWENKFNALLVRERLILTFVVFSVIYMVFELSVFGPSQRKLAQLTAEVETQKKQFESLKAEETILTKVLTTDPSVMLKKEYENLNEKLESIDKEIVALSAGLVSANQLAAMLQEVLLLSEGLQLEGLTTDLPQLIPMPSDGVLVQGKSNKINAQRSAQLRIYKQYVSLKLKGNYFQILTYLKRLEATRWRFYWDALRYRVNQYPEAVVEIRVYSLSIERNLDE